MRSRSPLRVGIVDGEPGLRRSSGAHVSGEGPSAIGNLYTEFAEAIRSDTAVTPDFRRAAEIQALLAKTRPVSLSSTLHPAGAET